MAISRVCILGGTGFVGRHIAEKLSERGVQTRILTRNRERHRETLLVLPELELLEANVYDPVTLETHFRGMDAVINLVGILNERKSGRNVLPLERRGDFHAVHVELPQLVTRICTQAGVPRLLHMSALGADPTGPSAYLRSKGIGQEIVRKAGEDSPAPEHTTDSDTPLVGRGLKVTIFRPSIIFGEGDGFFNRFADLLRRIPLFLPLAKPNARLQPVWVEDVAGAYINALDNPETYGQVYDLCGPQAYTLRELVTYTRDTIGIRKPIIGIPDWLAELQAAVLEKLPGQLLTRDNLRSLSVDNVCKGDCFPPVFKTQPTALEAIVPTYLGKGSKADQLSRIRRRRS